MRIMFQRVLILLVGGYFLYGGFTPKSCRLMNLADLAIHEGGHVVFGVFGEYVGMWGGTLTQLLFPLVIAISFFRHGDKFSAYVILCWFGQNFFHIAPYIKDATAQSLPLVGGWIHDWHFILGRAGLLGMDQWIGNAVWCAGFAVIAYSVFMGIFNAGEGNEKGEAGA